MVLRNPHPWCGGRCRGWSGGVGGSCRRGWDYKPALEAVKNGRTETVRALLKQREHQHGRGRNHRPAPGHSRSQHGGRRSADPCQRQREGGQPCDVTALSLAATSGDTAMMAALLKAGADANTAMPDGETVLMTAARTGKADAVNAAGQRCHGRRRGPPPARGADEPRPKTTPRP